MKNNEELIIQIPTSKRETVQFSLSVANTEKYTPVRAELDFLENKCVEITNNKDVSVLYLDF